MMLAGGEVVISSLSIATALCAILMESACLWHSRSADKESPYGFAVIQRSLHRRLLHRLFVQRSGSRKVRHLIFAILLRRLSG